jgi:hypothetical protein
VVQIDLIVHTHIDGNMGVRGRERTSPGPPGYAEERRITDPATPYRAIPPPQVPLFHGAPLRDLLDPGVELSTEHGGKKSTEAGFTRSTSAALCSVIPPSAIVGLDIGILAPSPRFARIGG